MKTFVLTGFRKYFFDCRSDARKYKIKNSNKYVVLNLNYFIITKHLAIISEDQNN